MNKIKSFYRNNRVFVILMTVASICLIAILAIVLTYLLGQNNGEVYGNRLNGIETVLIDDHKITTIENMIKEDEKVDKVKVKVIGRIIYINTYLTSGKGSDAKNIAIKSLDAFNDDEKPFYDISFIFDKPNDEEDKTFPIMGYKKSDNTIISWTNFSE